MVIWIRWVHLVKTEHPFSDQFDNPPPPQYRYSLPSPIQIDSSGAIDERISVVIDINHTSESVFVVDPRVVIGYARQRLIASKEL